MKPLNRAAIVGYGAGDAANSMIISTANMFLLVYYTDVAGIGAAAAGTLLVAARVFNAFTDIAAGRIVDRFHSRRWGKFRPFLVFGFIPLVLGVAVFHVPDAGPSLKLLYAYCTYFLVCLAYSLVNVPYGCLVGAMTQDPRDRARLAGARTIGGLSVGATLGLFVAPLVGRGGDVQQTFSVMTLVFAVVGSGLYVFTGIACREQVAGSVPRISWRQTVDALKANSPLVVLCLGSVLLVTGNSATVAAQFYYLRNVLSRVDLFPLMAATQVAITLALAVVMPRTVARWDKKAVFSVGCLLGGAGGLVIFLAPADAPWLSAGGMVLAQLSAATVSILTWALGAGRRHRGVRRVEDRGPGPGHQLRPPGRHPEAGHGLRRRPCGLRAGLGRLLLVRPGAGGASHHGHPGRRGTAARRPGAGRRRHHVLVPPHRPEACRVGVGPPKVALTGM